MHRCVHSMSDPYTSWRGNRIWQSCKKLAELSDCRFGSWLQNELIDGQQSERRPLLASSASSYFSCVTDFLILFMKPVSSCSRLIPARW